MPNETQLLDPINRRLLHELQADARLSMAELGRRVNLSAPAVAERVQRLERAGVITGYRAEVDAKAVGFPIGAVVRVRPTTRRLQKIPEVVDCHRITGEDCYFMRLQLRSMDDLEGILDRFLVLGQTTTSIIHSSPVAARPLQLRDEP
jgi:Lrp/AsnC family transcriptional regulator, leucine-responsive regulatory protein